MPFPINPLEYIFKMPFASSIRPLKMEPNETLSILHNINASMTPSRRLPLEILVYIKDEVHKPNTVWENIRSIWNAVSIDDSEHDPDDARLVVPDVEYKDLEKLLYKVVLDPNTMKYHIREDLPSGLSFEERYRAQSARRLGGHMSSADFLYRILCLFPEIFMGPADVWSADIRHKQTGFGLNLREHKAYGGLYPGYSRMHHSSRNQERTAEYYEKLQVFSEDCVKLLNALVETVDIDGEPQLGYFHPAAMASCPSSELRYIAVPIERVRDRISLDDIDERPFESWFPVQVSPADLSPLSPFHSLLPNLKYNVESRKIDPVKGTTPLTEVISSALLYYRLLCKYTTQDRGLGNMTPIIPSSSLGFPITSSVWQREFRHEDNHNALILFMDDHGLFDVRVNEEAMEVMDDIVVMINSLCSDDCTHIYDGTVAGCVP